MAYYTQYWRSELKERKEEDVRGNRWSTTSWERRITSAWREQPRPGQDGLRGDNNIRMMHVKNLLVNSRLLQEEDTTIVKVEMDFPSTPWQQNKPHILPMLGFKTWANLSELQTIVFPIFKLWIFAVKFFQSTSSGKVVHTFNMKTEVKHFPSSCTFEHILNILVLHLDDANAFISNGCINLKLWYSLLLRRVLHDFCMAKAVPYHIMVKV